MNPSTNPSLPATHPELKFTGGLVLLDVEGTVSPLTFVHDVMFPYAREHAGAFLRANTNLDAILERMAQDVGQGSFAAWCPFPKEAPETAGWVEAQVHAWMDADAKITGLKQLQGLIWEQGFKSGALRATLFDDVPAALRRWHAAGIALAIYSSGSVHAQKLFFSHTTAGDLTTLLSGYYDTTTGPKKESASYATIARASGFAPAEVLFLSDVTAELDAAQEAGMQTGLAIRPGNRETESVRHPSFHSLHDITPVRP